MIFFNYLEQFEDKTALIFESGDEMSYLKLTSDADELASNIGKRTLVFSICSNNAESIVGHVGFLRNRIVPILINPKIDKELFIALMNTYHPEYIWAPTGFSDGEVLFSYGHYSLIRTGYSLAINLHPDLALLLTTSGSTGSPKLVRQSYMNIRSNTESIIESLEITGNDRAITTLPLSYSYGLSIIQTHLAVGATIIITEDSIMSRTFWSLFNEQRATTFGGVPYTYEMLKKLKFAQIPLPSLKYITQSGGKLSKELSLEFAETCKEKGFKFIVTYGQSEATGCISYLPWKYSISKAGSIGIPIPHGKISIIDTDGNVITRPNTPGELIYYGDNVTLGYAECITDLVKGDENNCQLKTGDIAIFDDDGFYSIVGRKKRFLKIYGNRINLDEVECLLKANGFDCVVGGRDDLLRIFITDKSQLDVVKQFISKKIGLNHLSITSEYIATIPRNEAGKIQYGELPNW